MRTSESTERKEVRCKNRQSIDKQLTEHLDDVSSAKHLPNKPSMRSVVDRVSTWDLVSEPDTKPTYDQVANQGVEKTQSKGSEPAKPDTTTNTGEGRPNWYAQRHLMGPPTEKGVNPMLVARRSREAKQTSTIWQLATSGNVLSCHPPALSTPIMALLRAAKSLTKEYLLPFDISTLRSYQCTVTGLLA